MPHSLMPVPSAEHAVHILLLDDDENRFRRTSIEAINTALDEFDDVEAPKALVTSGHGKYFSNGLDLEYLMSGAEPAEDVVGDMMGIYARILGAPYPTVAGVNGHAFAGGAMFALAHDRRIMREDRGYFSINEVFLGMDLAPGMAALIQSRLTPQAAHIAITAGHRFAAAEAMEFGIVDATAAEGSILTEAVALADQLAPTASSTLGKLKRRMYGEVLTQLRDGTKS